MNDKIAPMCALLDAKKKKRHVVFDMNDERHCTEKEIDANGLSASYYVLSLQIVPFSELQRDRLIDLTFDI